MSSTQSVTPQYLQHLKNLARKRSKQKNLLRSVALEEVAKEHGFNNWHHANQCSKSNLHNEVIIMNNSEIEVVLDAVKKKSKGGDIYVVFPNDEGMGTLTVNLNKVEIVNSSMFHYEYKESYQGVRYEGYLPFSSISRITFYSGEGHAQLNLHQKY